MEVHNEKHIKSNIALFRKQLYSVNICAISIYQNLSLFTWNKNKILKSNKCIIYDFVKMYYSKIKQRSIKR